MILNSSTLKDLFVAFQAAFNTGFRDVETQWEKIATLVPSTTAGNEYGWLGQFPKLREWLGDRQVKAIAAHGYSILNKKFESTIEVPRDNIEDDQVGVFNPLFAEMGHAAVTHPDEMVFQLLGQGFAEKAFDGQFFFDTDHPVGDDGVVSNMQAGAEDPWFLIDASRPLKPLIFQRRRDYALRAMDKLDDDIVFKRDVFQYGVDARVNVGFGFWQQAFGSKDVLNEANFEAAFEAMVAFRSDEDRPLGIKPTLLVVGPSNWAAARKLILVDRLANGASNSNFQVVEVVTAPWLS